MTNSNGNQNNPLALEVSFTRENFSVSLDDGRILTIPLAWFPRLLNGTPEQRSHWELIGCGQGIHWELLDEDISINGLLKGRGSRSYNQPAPENQPQQEYAVGVDYDLTTWQVTISLNNGASLRFPPRWHEELKDVTDNELQTVTLCREGSAIAWPNLGIELSMAWLRSGGFGPGVTYSTPQIAPPSETERFLTGISHWLESSDDVRERYQAVNDFSDVLWVLQMSWEELTNQFGVTEQDIVDWKQGRQRIPPSVWHDMVAMAYDKAGLPPSAPFGALTPYVNLRIDDYEADEEINSARSSHPPSPREQLLQLKTDWQLSLEAIASLLNIPADTLLFWEMGAQEPSQAEQTLLDLLTRYPTTTKALLLKQKRDWHHWCIWKIKEPLNDPRPGIPHEEVQERMRELIEKARKRPVPGPRKDRQ